MGSNLRAICLALIALSCASVCRAQSATCRVEPFQGATLPQGAQAQMTVVSGGPPCRIVNFGSTNEPKNFADSGSITVPPRHGVAAFVPPRATYQPEPGYVGDDEFSYEAFAKGNIGQQVRLKVRVAVKVVAP